MNSIESTNDFSRIRLLPDPVANQIAAGEVVDRPASVLKELTENAIDAGAGRLDVQVVLGGRKLISVADDGVGMNRDDALMAIERHATSKIRKAEDIEKIDTLGFRGEALPSIASISRFLLKTCLRESLVGTEVVVNGGLLRDVREIGMPPGTVVEIRDIFFNTPARRKFLRTQATELSHLRSVFLEYALAYPGLAMTFTSDARRISSLPRGSQLADRLRDIYGQEFLEKLIPLDLACGEMRASGFMARPGSDLSQRGEQYIFINHRPASAPLLYYVLREFHGGAKASRPPIFLFLDMPSDRVDVNVHPAKREVRFRNPGRVRDFLFETLEKSLQAQRLSTSESAGGILRSTENSTNRGGGLPISAAPRLPPRRSPPLPFENGSTAEPSPSLRPCGIANASSLASPVANAVSRPADPAQDPFPHGRTEGASGEEASNSPWAWHRIMGLVADRYVLLETDAGFVVLDPKAAHERVLFERMLNRMQRGESLSQRLLIPQSVALPPTESRLLRRHRETLRQLGFGLHDFGDDHFMIDALPDTLEDAPCEGLLLEIAHSLENAGTRRGRERWREESVIRAAVHAAVRSSHRFAREEIEQLVADLASTEMPYICPAGRPVMIFTSLNELARRFGREIGS